MSGVRQQPVAGGRGGWRVGPAALLARGSDHTKLLLELQSRRTSTIATVSFLPFCLRWRFPFSIYYCVSFLEFLPFDFQIPFLIFWLLYLLCRLV
ncbi:unnamed protein product, partial [Urochloa humidicola]